MGKRPAVSRERLALTPAPPASARRFRGALAAIVAGTALVRLRIAGMPLERDEGEYAYVGQLILQGEWPYGAAHNMKLPGIYYAYATILGLFGQTDVAIRTALMLVNAATIVLVALLARRLAGETAALTAAAAFAATSLATAVLGFTANAEHFVLLPAMAGLLLLTKDPPSGGRLLAAGLLLGVGFVMKQPGAAFIACGAAWIALDGGPPRRLATALATFGLGAVTPYALTCLAMLLGGVFASFWFWTVVYLREYGTMVEAEWGFAELRKVLGGVVAASPLTWLLAAVGLVALATPLVARRARWRVLALVAVSAAAVAPGLRFTDHYFLLLLPALAIVAGIGTEAPATRLGAASARAARAVALAAPVLILVLALIHDRANLLLRSPIEAARETYGLNPLVEAVEIAEQLAARSSPDDRIAVVGSEPQIYFYARRRAATSYMYMYPLMEPQPFAARMQDEMIAQLESARPRFLVLVNVDMSWSRRPGSSLKILDWAAATVDAGYRQIGLVELIPGAPSRSVWGDAAATAAPQSRAFLAVFERKA